MHSFKLERCSHGQNSSHFLGLLMGLCRLELFILNSKSLYEQRGYLEEILLSKSIFDFQKKDSVLNRQ